MLLSNVSESGEQDSEDYKRLLVNIDLKFDNCKVNVDVYEILFYPVGVGYTLAVAYMTYMAGTSIFRGWLAVFLVNSFQEPLPWTHCNNDWNTAACRPNHFVNQSVNSKVNRTENATSANTTISYNSSTKFMTAAEEFWQYDLVFAFQIYAPFDFKDTSLQGKKLELCVEWLGVKSAL